MRRGKVGGAFAGAALLLAVFGSAWRSDAWAESTGGSIGKRDKSVSGVEDTSPKEPAAPSRGRARPQPEPRAAPSAASVGGTWRWNCNCTSGNVFQGTFNFNQAGSSFTGVMLTTGHGTGQVSNGNVSGGRVTFMVTLTNVIERTEHWTGRLSGGHMQGSLTTRFDGDCEFTADR